MFGKIALCVAMFFSLPLAPAASAQPLAQARQLVLVTTDGWSSSQGTLQRFTRPSPADRWAPAGSRMAVNLGRNGLAWGRGLHDASVVRDGPVKKEGDGRAPAGVFELPLLFGYLSASSLAARSAKLPYREATPTLKCVDDSQSRHYNALVELGPRVSPDWQSKEDMRREDHQYAWGVVVAHNAEPAVSQGGSCIFIHVWFDPLTPTSGCTAGAAPDIAELFLWLDAASRPVLVQLPGSEYQRLKHDWQLP